MRYETRCERCSESELKAVTKFAGEVFDVDFPRLLPYIYGDRAATGHNHFVVRENGEYAAAVLNFPNNLHVADRVLGVMGVGTVCVREESRGRGYMSDMLAECILEARDRGAAFLILSGRRQRYEHYGFAVTGVHSSYRTSPASVRHCLGDRPSAFVLEEGKPEDGGLCVEIMKERSVYADRTPENFYAASVHGENRLFIIREGDRAVGYCVTDDRMNEVIELAFRRDTDPAKAVDEFILAACGIGATSINFEVPFHEFRLAERLSAICDGWGKGPCAGMCFIDLPAAITAFGRLRYLGDDLDGTKLVLEIEEHPFLSEIGAAEEGLTHGKLRIFVKDGYAAAEPTDLPADLKLPYLRAVELLFSDLGVLAYDLPGKARSVLPIPLYFPGPDKV